MGYNTRITLVDIDTVTNPDTGKRETKIVKQQDVYADEQDVGQEEYYSAAGSNIKLAAVFEIPKVHYTQEKYIVKGTQPYEVVRPAKGHTLAYVKLVCKTDVSSTITKLLTGGK